MKIRSGFVSNSSSSSFIVVGCDLSKKIEKRLIEKLKIDEPDDKDWLYDGTVEELGLEVLYTEEGECGYIIGKVLSDFSNEDYLESASYSFDDLKKLEEKVHKVLGEDVKVSLMVGTRPS